MSSTRKSGKNLALGLLALFVSPSASLSEESCANHPMGNDSLTGVHMIATKQLAAQDGSSLKNSRSYKLLYASPEGTFGQESAFACNEQPDAFHEKFSSELRRRKSAKFLVFVHGYNSTTKRTYRIANNLTRALNMPAVIFAWQSRKNPLAYTPDECTAEWSSWQLARELRDLSQRYGSSNIILVGHSMGCRMICWALAQAQLDDHTRFNQVLLCSPDIDSSIFEENIPLLTARSGETTIFASTKDARLRLSKLLHGNARLGLLPKSAQKNSSASASSLTAVSTTNDTSKNKRQTSPIKREVFRTFDLTNNIKVIDYTKQDHSIFGHAVPYALLHVAQSGG